MPSIASMAISSSEKRRGCGRSRVPYETTFCPTSLTSLTQSADRAGVEEDQVGILRLRRLAVPQRLEHALHALGVVLVHLAPEGRDVVSFMHMKPSSPHKGTRAIGIVRVSQVNGREGERFVSP